MKIKFKVGVNALLIFVLILSIVFTSGVALAESQNPMIFEKVSVSEKSMTLTNSISYFETVTVNNALFKKGSRRWTYKCRDFGAELCY